MKRRKKSNKINRVIAELLCAALMIAGIPAYVYAEDMAVAGDSDVDAQIYVEQDNSEASDGQALANEAALSVLSASGERVKSVSLGLHDSAAITESGDLYCWGYNSSGQVGNGTTEDQLTPVKILGGISAVSLGTFHSAAITEEGDLYCWGYNTHGQVGNGTTEDQLTPVKILNGVNFVSLEGYCSAAITEEGDLYCWGENDCGQVGNGTTENQLMPVKILSGISSVSLGDDYGAAITEEGDLYCWGENDCGQVGNGTTENQLTPVKILSGISSVSLGASHSAAITEGGDLYCWGNNVCGEVGNGTIRDQLTPVKILNGISSVLLGTNHSAAITEGGDLYCWGVNYEGEVGNGATQNQLTPVKILGGISSVSSGSYYSAAITEGGDLYCWGVNDCGQVGNGTTEDQLTPVKILSGINSVSLGYCHSVAITEGGNLYCWGGNDCGRVGNGTTSNQLTPMKIVLASRDDVEELNGKADVYFKSTISKQQVTHTIDWYDDWFDNCSNTEYLSKLSIASMSIAAAAYNEPYDCIEPTLDNLGFTDIDTDSYTNRMGNDGSDYSETEDLVAYAFGHKTITNDSGNKRELVVIAVRGTPQNVEWLSNANIADSVNDYDVEYHEGFRNAEVELRNSLYQYVTDQGIDTASAAILITGHSRGGAVANLLAADLDTTNYSDLSSVMEFQPSNIYAYTFATPCCTTSKDAWANASYKNIFNVVNPEDFVPRIPFQAWGFKRYGTTYYLPSKSTDTGTFWKYKSQMEQIFKDITGKAALPYKAGTARTDGFVRSSLSAASTTKEYYKRTSFWDGTYVTYRNWFGYLTHYIVYEDYASLAKIIGTSAVAGCYTEILTYFIQNKTISQYVEYAHTQETYLSWLEALDSASSQVYDSGPDYLQKQGKVNNTAQYTYYCPVDLVVYDKDNHVVAEITNDEVNEELLVQENSLAVYVDETTGEKILYVPLDSAYRIECIATDEGMLDITCAYTDAENDRIEEVAFNDLALEEGTEYKVETKEIESIYDEEEQNIDVSVADTMTLAGEGNEEIEADYIVGEETERFAMDITSADEEQGSVAAPSTAVKGEHVIVSAYPADGYTFVGWYDGKQMISSETVYTFVVEREICLKAYFEMDSTNYIRGDVNEDKAVDIRDCRIILRGLCGEITLSERQCQLADVVEDGEVDIRDLRRILLCVCGKLTADEL